MKKRNILVSCLFSMAILFVGVYVMFIKTPTTRLAMELRTATQFIGPTVQNVSEGFFQDTFEKAFSDQFMKRSLFLKAYNYLEHKLYDLSLPNKKSMTLVKIGEDVYTFPTNDDYLTAFPVLKREDYNLGIENFTTNVNAIAAKYSDVNFYVYKPFRLNESDWFDEDNGFASYGKTYSEKFFSRFSDLVITAENEIDSLETYKQYYYKTDPHWNAYGSYEGYKDLVGLFKQNYSTLTPYEYTGVYCFEDFEFYGQYGRNATYLTSSDRFCDLNFELPEYRTYVNGVEKQYDQKEAFKNNTIEEFYWNYIYSVYHGNDEAEVHFQNDQNAGRNLLAFVDSYSSPIKALIASHFDNAYFIDPRINPEFNFREFMETHEITDVLYMGFYGSLYADESYIFDDF